MQTSSHNLPQTGFQSLTVSVYNLTMANCMTLSREDTTTTTSLYKTEQTTLKLFSFIFWLGPHFMVHQSQSSTRYLVGLARNFFLMFCCLQCHGVQLNLVNTDTHLLRGGPNGSSGLVRNVMAVMSSLDKVMQ